MILSTLSAQKKKKKQSKAGIFQETEETISMKVKEQEKTVILMDEKGSMDRCTS